MDAWATNLIPCCDTDCTVVPWSPVFDKLNVQKKVSAEQSDAVSTYEWEQVGKSTSSSRLRKGLLGGAMHKPINNVKERPKQKLRQEEEESSSSTEVANEPKPRLHNEVEHDYDGGILPLPSFDYSHIHAGHNDMVPPPNEQQQHHLLLGRESTLSPSSRRKKQPTLFPMIPEDEKKADEDPYQNNDNQVSSATQPFLHGVPIFLSTLSQIRITKVSAHPLGAHVLLISAEALLFSYGLNNHGQLGIGVKSNVKDDNRGFISTPTIITPLLENGGKAIHCAAGVDHSLVVVQTEGRRLQKLKNDRPDVAHSEVAGTLNLSRVTSSPSRFHVDNVDADSDVEDLDNNSPLRSATDESVQHHQLYGFGSNDFMKLGLIGPTLAEGGALGEDVLLPRRVALHCTVWPEKQESSSSTASNHHNQSSCLPPQGVFELAASMEHSAALVRKATGDVEVYVWGNATLGALGISLDPDSLSDIQYNAGYRERPVSDANNIFPIPTVVESLSCRKDRDRDSSMEFPTELSLGPYCSFVVMSSGRCMSFGFSVEGMLGQGFGVSHAMEPKEVFLPAEKGKKEGIVSVSAGAHHVIALTESGRAYSWGINSNDRLGLGSDGDFVSLPSNPTGMDEDDDVAVVEWVPHEIDLKSRIASSQSEDAARVVRVCAGYDSSLLVVRSGEVLSFGKRSGRMGLGEVSGDVSTPKPLFGGLRLFHNNINLGQTRRRHKRMASTGDSPTS
jgi:alpha-tubulin suppressor-like RCC1 family protein